MAVNDPSLDSSSNAPSVSTDLFDYTPGSTAVITAANFVVGSTIIFQVSHVLDAGADGQYGTLDDTVDAETNASGDGHEPWSVTDGVRITLPGLDGAEGTADDVVAGDLDGIANGTVVTNWLVNPDDSLGARFLVSAGGTGGQQASSTFTDSAYFADPVPTNPVDLTVLGTEATVNSAIFSQFTFNAGSGFIDSFVRVQHNTVEDGYNTDFRTGSATEFE
jgi:hypothetical protein